MSWFIESWSPLAGHAFAVHRNYTYASDHDQARDVRTYLAADEIYAIEPPDFLPVPCSAEAAALWATRGPFQHGFIRADGAEYRFESLAQLVELVRRVYLAGGMSPPGQLDIRPPLLPNVPSPPGDWEEVLRALADRDRSAHDPVVVLRRPDRRAIDVAADAIEMSMKSHEDGIRDLSLEALGCLCHARRQNGSVTMRDELAWSTLIAEMNPWHHWEYAAQAIAHYRYLRPPQPFGWPGAWPFAACADMHDAFVDGLLFKIPAPLPGNALHHAARLRTLGDHLTLAMADPRYVTGAASAREVLPLYVAALALAAASSWDYRAGAMDRGFEVVRRKGAHWLAEHLPNALAPIPGADIVIEQILQDRGGVTP